MTKLSLGPDHDLRYTKWTEVVQNCFEMAILEGFMCWGTKLSPGPDNDPIPQVHEMDESRTKQY